MSRDASPIEIRDYDCAWPRLFQELAARVLTALGSSALRAEHVGSTAVTGLAARPIIDLDVVVAAQGDLPEVIRRLGTLGYVHQGDLGIPGREAFRGTSAEPRHHLYACVEGAAELTRHLRFRDALRTDSDLRDRYAELKRSLAALHGNDRSAYTNAKHAFIEGVLAQAGAGSRRKV
jgi:GrpB-like predicted nucleotidyltransferase (UPF0157 family)